MSSTTNWTSEITKHARKVYSQRGQDGVLEYVFSNVTPRNRPPFCVEFGFNASSLTAGSGSNVANLVLNSHWSCLLLDANYENADINLHKHLLRSDNICDIFREYKVPSEPEYVSVDVDSTDLWLFRALLEQFRPMLVSVEYNANFPIDHAITHPPEGCLFNGECTYGASLKALDLVARSFSYALIHVVTGLDAFFIRRDLVRGMRLPELADFAKQAGYPCHRRATAERAKTFLDYEEYLQNGGNLAKAQEKAAHACQKYMVEPVA
jgi:hypothetical protein